jgi:hypothetical protein
MADSIPPGDTEDRLRWLEKEAERAYSGMYEVPFGAGTTGLYSDAKQFLDDAIALALRLGKREDAERSTERLAHIKAVFRSQFPG